MDSSYSNSNKKSSCFFNNDVNCTIMEVDDQHITCQIKYVECAKNNLVTYVYVKYKDHLRRPLWDIMLYFSEIHSPWCIIGEFHVKSST